MDARRHIRTEQGQTLVETAIAVPLMLMLLFGIIQFGVVFKDYLALTDAVRIGGREAAVSRQIPNPNGAAEAAVRGAATDLDSRLEVTVTSPWTPGADVTVTARYPYSIEVVGLEFTSGWLSSSTTERVE